MTAEIRFTVEWLDNPWRTEGQKKTGMSTKAWFLVRQLVLDDVVKEQEPIAIFNQDSQAELFQRHLVECNGKVLPSRDYLELHVRGLG